MCYIDIIKKGVSFSTCFELHNEHNLLLLMWTLLNHIMGCRVFIFKTLDNSNYFGCTRLCRQKDIYVFQFHVGRIKPRCITASLNESRSCQIEDLLRKFISKINID